MRRAAIVCPIRTPVGKFLGTLAPVAAGELGAVILRALVARTGIDPETIDDVIFAQGYGNGEAPCIARWSALAAGLPISIPGYQLDRRCGSGLQAVIDAAMMVQIRGGRCGRGRRRGKHEQRRVLHHRPLPGRAPAARSPCTTAWRVGG